MYLSRLALAPPPMVPCTGWAASSEAGPPARPTGDFAAAGDGGGWRTTPGPSSPAAPPHFQPSPGSTWQFPGHSDQYFPEVGCPAQPGVPSGQAPQRNPAAQRYEWFSACSAEHLLCRKCRGCLLLAAAPAAGSSSMVLAECRRRHCELLILLIVFLILYL